MKLFLRYLRSKAGVFIVLAVFAVIFAASFLLFKLPVEALLYPLSLCVLIGAAFLAADFARTKEKSDTLSRLYGMTTELINELPQSSSVTDDEYKKIITSLAEGKQRLAEDEFRRYNDMIAYFTVWVHQIKTPIAAMRISLQNEDTPFARKLQNDLNRIESYTEMVLTYIRLGSNSTDYVFKKYDLDKTVRSAVKRFSGEFIGKKLALDYRVPEGFFVLTDEKWLQFVIEQVLSNAVKYTNAGTVSIYTEAPSTLCIKDTGIGIAAEDLPRIFENGFTGFNGREDKKATGIGLYLCKRICNDLGHTIKAESVVSEGTTIKITFDEKVLPIE